MATSDVWWWDEEKKVFVTPPTQMSDKAIKEDPTKYLTVMFDNIFIYEEKDWFGRNDVLILTKVGLEEDAEKHICRVHFFGRDIKAKRYMGDILADKAFSGRLTGSELHFSVALADLDDINAKKLQSIWGTIKTAIGGAARSLPDGGSVSGSAVSVGDAAINMLSGWNRIQPILKVSAQFALKDVPNERKLYRGIYVFANRPVDLTPYKYSNSTLVDAQGLSTKFDFSFVIFNIYPGEHGKVYAENALNYLYGKKISRMFDQIHSDLTDTTESEQESMSKIEMMLEEVMEGWYKYRLIKQKRKLLNNFQKMKEEMKKTTAAGASEEIQDMEDQIITFDEKFGAFLGDLNPKT